MNTTTKNPGEGNDEVKQPIALDTKKVVNNHKEAANHLQEASKHHLEAASHHENGDHEKAGHSTVKANGHHEIANDLHKENVKHQALSTNSKQTNTASSNHTK